MPVAKIMTPINLGPLNLLHRAVIMAPSVPNDEAADPTDVRHATQGGLVLQPFEAPISPATIAPACNPPTQRNWQTLTKAVRAKGGFTFAQLSCFASGTTSDQSAAGTTACRGMATQALAMQFDGAELELPGPVEGAPALLDMVEVLINVWGADRVGVQITPFAWMSAPNDESAVATFTALLSDLSDMEIAYVHLAGAAVPGRGDPIAYPLSRQLRAAYPGILIASGGFTPEAAFAAVERRWADLVGFPLLAGGGNDLLAALMRCARKHGAG